MALWLILTMVFAALVGFHHRDVEPNVLGAAGERQTSPGHDRSDSRGLDFVVSPLFFEWIGTKWRKHMEKWGIN